MAIVRRSRFINPKLGTYYSIFTSAFVCVVLGALILEQMGVSRGTLGLLMLVAPLLLAGVLGAASATHTVQDFFASGRRTPSFFAGLALAITTLGGVGFASITGTVTRLGMDGLVLVLGWLSGLVLTTVLIAPFLNKCGAFSLASYFGMRFESRILRMGVALFMAIPCVFIAAAEIRLAGQLGSWLSGQPVALVLIAGAALVTTLAVLGGMRALTWTAVAWSIVAIVAIAVPATIVSLMVSNLPLPQMLHGNVLRGSAGLERAQDLPQMAAHWLQFRMPGVGLEAISNRFLAMFGNVGRFAMPLSILVIATGIAAMPATAQRVGTVPGVHDARKALSWAVLITGFVLLTLLSISGYLRGYLVQQVVGAAGDRLPLWFQSLEQMGLMEVASKSRTVTLSGVLMQRDGAILALPVAAGLPLTLVLLTLAGVIAAALAAAMAHIVALGTLLSEDLVHGGRRAPPDDNIRLHTGRIGMIAAGVATTTLALSINDPLVLALAGLTLAAGGAFPILVLSILWKRLTRFGALLGALTGMAVTGGLMASSAFGSSPLPMLLSAAIGGPLSFLVAALVSRVTPAPSRTMMELVRDMRVPGGETIYDREMRLIRRGRTAATSVRLA